MKSLIMSLLLLPTLAGAQDYTNTNIENPDQWYVVGGNSRAADVFELGAMTRTGQIVGVRSVLYLTRPGNIGQGDADYVVTGNEFDCHTPGRYRILSEQHFAVDTPDPLLETNYSQWHQDTQPNSVGLRLWKVVCANLRDDSVFLVRDYVGKNTYTHSDVLKKVRQQARDAGY